MRSKLLFCLFLCLSFGFFSQTKSEIVQQRIEFISEQLGSEEADLTNLIEQLNYYIDNPINLNNTSFDELENLGLLTDVQINDVLLHIKQFGKFISIYELQSLKYWDLQTIDLVRPFIRVDNKLDQLHVSLKEALKYGRMELYIRYQTIAENKAGYADVPDSVKQQSNNYYYGNDERYYSRFRFSYRTNLSIGITAEKDPGEQFFRGSQKNGFDFYSAHIFYKGGKYLKAIALGDYQVQVGQGLNLWSGYAFGKSADVCNIKKNAQALRAYTSADENRFMRGAAVDLGYKNFGLTMFASFKGVDGAVTTDTTLIDFNEAGSVASIDMFGFHRTTSEIAQKDQLQERIVGANLKYSLRGLNIGTAAVYYGYDVAFNPDLKPYNQFDFRGKSNFALSADYSYVWRNVNLFGEISRASFSGDMAMLQGLIMAIDSKASISVLARNYQKGYQTFYNYGFGEARGTQNEKGIYVGLRTKLASAWTLNAYMDYFQSPWMKYQVDGPSVGHEFLGQISYKPNKIMEFYVRFREQTHQKNSRDLDELITPLENVLQRNYRANFSYQVNEAIQFKSRVEYVTINRPSNDPEKGMIFTQDLLLKPKSKPYDIALRYALFDTDSYDTRIYTFETNAQYVFSVPAYYYQGSRAYITLRYTFLRRFDLWLRYGTYIYSNRTTLSSGTEEIAKNTKTDITVQLRIKL